VARANIINVSVLRMIFLAFWIILLAHWTACGWAALGGGNIPIEEQGDKARLYLRCLYWAVTTIATIGYGDITPQTNYQTIFAMAIELIGAGLYGYVIGVVASLIANLDVARSQFLEKLEKINTFMRFRKIPNEIQDRIRNYYGYLWDSRRGYDESQVLTDLPASLKMQVSLYLNKDIIEKVPIFRGASEDLVQQIVMNLKPIVFTPGDFIFRQGEIGTSMFFISRGSVEVVSVDGRTVYATLTEGGFFGEIALLLSQPRNASIRALDYTDLYTLDKDTFQRILENFPDFLDHIREMAKKRQKEIQKEETQSPDTAPRGEVRPHRVPRLHAHRVGPSISLEWESARDANSYQLIRMDPASNRWKTICYSVIETRYLDDNPGPSELLSYRVRGLNQSGPGEWSEPVSTP